MADRLDILLDRVLQDPDDLDGAHALADELERWFAYAIHELPGVRARSPRACPERPPAWFGTIPGS